MTAVLLSRSVLIIEKHKIVSDTFVFFKEVAL